MAFVPDYRTYAPGVRADAAAIDTGLRAYMVRVYNWMVSGLLLTGITSYAVANTGARDFFYHRVVNQAGQAGWAPTGLGYLSIFAPLAFVMAISFGINRMSRSTVQALFWAFSVAMGVSMSNIFLMFAHDSIFQVFLITAITFGGMSLWGYTTKTDLTKMGSFLVMGLWGVIVASVVNMFIQSGPLAQLVSYVGVLVFVGLTAYDTQRIKADYVQYAYAEGSDLAAKRSVMDSLMLYLNFINLFMLLLQIMGNRSNNN